MGMALYRKHRSKSLDEVVGQKHITNTLKMALKNDAISHAYLFTGPRGVGKTSVARILAHEINEIPYDDESIHLDIIEIDAASNRRIDEIRDLRDKVNIVPTTSKFKVYIIDEVHMLTREAFNALLKTLEEPPNHVVFILATTEAHKVPETITSRTQKFTFKSIDDDIAFDHLRNIAEIEDIKISDEALKMLVNHANGSFRDSISMLDQVSAMSKNNVSGNDVKLLLGLPDQSIIQKIIDHTIDNNPSGLFNSIDELKEQGVDSAQAAKAISQNLRLKLAVGQLDMPHDVAVKLLKDLLPTTYGSNNYLMIELCMLDAMNIKDNGVVIVQKNREKPIGIEKFEKDIIKTKTLNNSKKNEKPKIKLIKSSKNTFDFEATWQELLNDIKGHHNTLYGILRMANCSKVNDEIIMEFKFGFHKKRVDSSSHKKTIRLYLEKYFNTTNYNTVVTEKNSNVINNVETEKPNKNIIENVSNIFKGAELIDS